MINNHSDWFNRFSEDFFLFSVLNLIYNFSRSLVFFIHIVVSLLCCCFFIFNFVVPFLNQFGGWVLQTNAFSLKFFIYNAKKQWSSAIFYDCFICFLVEIFSLLLKQWINQQFKNESWLHCLNKQNIYLLFTDIGFFSVFDWKNV